MFVEIPIRRRFFTIAPEKTQRTTRSAQTKIPHWYGFEIEVIVGGKCQREKNESKMSMHIEKETVNRTV